MRRHGPGLLFVLTAALAGQAALLSRRPLSMLVPGSTSYLFSAAQFRTRFDLLYAEHPPGYGVFLGLLQVAGGLDHPGEVVVAQAALTVACALAVYAAVCLAGGERMPAAAAGGLTAFALSALGWERVIAPAALVSFELVVVVALLVLWLRWRRPAMLALVAGAAAAAALTHPALMYLPGAALALAAVPGWRHWRQLAVAAAAAYLVIGAYAFADDQRYPGAGPGDLANQQLFAKVMEDRLQPAAGDQRWAAMREQVVAYTAAGGSDPLEFGVEHPDVVGPWFGKAADYSWAAIAAHPVRFLSLSLAATAAPGLFVVLPLWLLVVVARPRDPGRYAALCLAVLTGLQLLVASGTATYDAAWLSLAALPAGLAAGGLMAGLPLRWLAARSGSSRLLPAPAVQPSLGGLP